MSVGGMSRGGGDSLYRAWQGPSTLEPVQLGEFSLAGQKKRCQAAWKSAQPAPPDSGSVIAGRRSEAGPVASGPVMLDPSYAEAPA